MSHAEKYFCIHKALAADAGTTTFRIEILEDGFGGSATEVNGLGEVFRLHYEKTDTRNPLESPIQKGRLEFIMAVEDSADLAIVNEFVGADETQYQMRLKKDGSVIWTGYILSDLLSYSEDDYPIPATIVAKDLSRLSAGTYPLEDERETIITTIADILDELGFGLSIYTYTSWTEQNLDGSIAGDYDFLNNIYNETFALREYASSGDETDQPITNQEALQSILVNYGLILRQVDNAWRLYQLSALGDPTSVLQFEYNSSGVQQSSSTVNIDSDIDRSNRYVLPSSVSNVNPGLKRVRSTFNHRSRVAELTLPRNVYITGAGQESYSQSFISTGEQEIKLSGTLRAYHSTQESSGYADLLVRVGQYYFNGNNWTTTTTDRVRIDITGFPVQREDDDGNYFYYQGFFDISTPKVPGDATTPIEIEFENAVIEAGPDVVADETAYENIDFNIIKPGDDEANSAALVYQLRQSGSYSSNVDLGETLFGDGPAVSSKSALRYSTATNDITSTSWQRRGTTSGYRLMHENLFKELIDLQRTNTRNMNAEVYGNYSPVNMISYDSENFFFLGGYLSGRNYWQASFLRINIQTASDTFETIIKSTSGGVQGASSTTSGGGSGGIDQSTADARYFKQASLLSEVSASDLSTLYGNIGLDDGSADLDLNSLDINGSTFVDSSRNVGANDGTFDGDVGIGTSSPSTDLHVYGSLGRIYIGGRQVGSNPLLGFWHPDLTGESHLDYRIELDRSNGTFNFRTGGSLRMSISGTGGVTISDTLTINSQLLFTQGNEQLLSTDANVQFNEVDIGGNWKLDSESEGGIERLRIQALGVDDGAELFIQSKGSADLARITLTPDPSPSNYSFVTFESNGSHQIINSSSEGTESTLPLSIRMDGAEALGVDTSRNLTTHANIADDGFSSGWIADGGQGYGITQDPSASAQWNAEFNELLVRGRLKVFELIVKQIATLGGTEILSVAVAEADSVSGSAGSETVTITDPRGFGGTSLAADDLVIVQRVDINDSTLVKQEFRTVSSITGTDVTFTSTSGAPAPSDAIEAGDIIVAYGNTSDSARQNMIFRSVDDQLVIRLQEGVDSYADYNDPSATSKLIIGDLDDAPDLSNGTTPTGRGFFAKGNAYLEGEIVASSGDIADWDILSGGILKGSLGDGRIEILSDNTFDQTGAHGGSTELGIPTILMMKQDTDFSDRMYLSIGETFVAGWTGRIGISMTESFSDSTPYFELSKDASTGAITANIASINFDDSKLWTGDGTNGYVGLGATSGATDRAFWAGSPNEDGSGDAAFFVQQDGRIFHDAVGSGVYARTELASFTANSDASSITDQEYSTTVSDTTNGTHTDRDTKVRTVALKRFGADTLIVSGYGRSDGDSNSGATTTTPRARIYIKATDLETSATNEASASLSSGSGQFSISLDISSLTDGNNMLLEVDAEAEIEISGADGSTYTGECYLREDVFIQTATS